MSELVCQHGSFRRKCELCERDDRIKELEARVKELETANEILGADVVQQLERVTLAEAKVKELEGALQEILAVPVTVTGDSDLLRQRHLVDGIAERVLRGEE